MQPDDAEVEANMGVFLRRSLAGGAGIAPGWAAWAGRLLQVSKAAMVHSAARFTGCQIYRLTLHLQALAAVAVEWRTAYRTLLAESSLCGHKG